MKILIKCNCGTIATFEDADQYNATWAASDFAKLHRDCKAPAEPGIEEALNRDAVRVARPAYEQSVPGVVAL